MAALYRQIPMITSLRVPPKRSEVGDHVQVGQRRPHNLFATISNLRSSKILRLEIIHMSYNTKESGKRIQTLRLQNGYTQEVLANKLNIDRSLLSHIESGKRGCSIDLFIRLSSVFDVSLDMLILGKEKITADTEDRDQLKLEVIELIDRLETFKEKLY